MEAMEAILTRRSVRKFKPEPVKKEQLEELIMAAKHAPSAMNTQPWAFGILHGVDRLRELSDRAKKFSLGSLVEQPVLARYKETFEDPDFQMFYDAPVLFVIYAKEDNPLAAIDCTLAAENVMLAAREMQLGTCWIGLSQLLLNSPQMKKELGVPGGYLAIAPIIVGHPDETPAGPPREEPEILFWE